MRHFAGELSHFLLGAVETVKFEHLFGKLFGIGLIEDSEICREPETVDVAAQHLYAETVDCAYEIIDTPGTDQCRDAGTHLLGGLVGKCHAENVGGVDSEVVDQMCESVYEHPRLSGSGAGHEPHLTFSGSHGFALEVVERVKYRVVVFGSVVHGVGKCHCRWGIR